MYIVPKNNMYKTEINAMEDSISVRVRGEKKGSSITILISLGHSLSLILFAGMRWNIGPE
jgi:hypothetical protein